MTQEEQKAENIKAQHISWVANEKANFRRIAMQAALSIKLQSGCDLITESDKIYTWLTQDLQQ